MDKVIEAFEKRGWILMIAGGPAGLVTDHTRAGDMVSLHMVDEPWVPESFDSPCALVFYRGHSGNGNVRRTRTFPTVRAAYRHLRILWKRQLARAEG
jgi:hypothetical protein